MFFHIQILISFLTFHSMPKSSCYDMNNYHTNKTEGIMQPGHFSFSFSFSLLLRLSILWLATLPVLQAAEQPRQWAKVNMDHLLGLYSEFHSSPELSFQEENTAARLANAWINCGFEVTTGIGGYGIVGLLQNGAGPVVMLRADMDALPVTEQTGLPFASRVQIINDDGPKTGVMHACGHDVHMTNLVGTACYLANHRSQWQGTLMLVGQPAEEKGAGARAMLEDGLFENFLKPDFAIALHVTTRLAAGKIGFRPGFTTANVDSVEITLYGKGGHGAYPHTTNDPIISAAQLVMALQTIISREIDPLEPAVITIGSLHAGTKNNVIGDLAELKLTVRSLSDEVREHILSAIIRKTRAIASGNNAPEPLILISRGTPSLYNDPKLASRLRRVLQQQLGMDNVELLPMTMGGEDFSRYGKEGVPILMYWLGVVSQQRLDDYAAMGESPPSLHSAKFYPDIQASLLTGVSSMTSIVLELMKPKEPMTN
jgi:hippurate hydrolase